MTSPISRRRFLQVGLAASAAALAPAVGQRAAPGLRTTGFRAPRRPPPRRPGSLPDPRKPPGTDLLPQIDHIVVVMMENHSYDNYLGMLGRGEGFTLDRHHRPHNSNPDGMGNRLRAFHLTTTCQLERSPSQAWNASHIAFDGGRQEGFVRASGPIAMAYWTGDDIPFYYSLARTFPLCDRWFASCLGQTYPNRRFLMAATAYGLVSTDVKAILAPSPPSGTIFERLNAYGISWRNYYSDLPQAGLFKSATENSGDTLVSVDRYFADAAAGTLPAFSLVDPPFVNAGSEENSDNIQIGEAFVSRVVNAAMHGAGWRKTVLIWLYDEHGGYYDHVPPPKAIPPDDIPPDIHVPPDEPGGYDRYGFRVPAVVVSPFARRRYVSHVVRDHTSILKLLEKKWNLPALTLRDANADDLLDCLDLSGRPAFLDPPKLAEPGQRANPSGCQPGEVGTVPPPDAVIPARGNGAPTSREPATARR